MFRFVCHLAITCLTPALVFGQPAPAAPNVAPIDVPALVPKAAPAVTCILVSRSPLYQELGLAPAVVAAGGATLGTFLAASMNAALALRLAGEGVSTFDIFGLGTSFTQHPGAFGFTNVTDACGAVAGANCNTYEFWDGIHPTAAAHMVIADAFVAFATVPEPSTWAMMILGFAGIGFMGYRRSRKSTKSTMALTAA